MARPSVHVDECHSFEVIGAGTGVELDIGWGRAAEARSFVAPTVEGVSIGIVMDGKIAIRVGGEPEISMTRREGFILSSIRNVEVTYSVASEDYRLVVLHLRRDGIAVARRLDRHAKSKTFTAGLSRGTKASLGRWAPGAAALAVSNHILCCAHAGSVRELFLEAKRLELLAVVTQQVTGVAPIEPGNRNKNDKISSARAIIIAEYRNPPSLDALAERVGVSTSLLTQQFRKRYGTSVVDFLQSYRLGLAYQCLQEGNSVSQAAYSAGYSLTHFTTLFRRKFGVSPGSLKRVPT